MLKDANAEARTDSAPINTRVPQDVRIVSGYLEEDALSPSGVIIRGEIDKNTLRFIKRDMSYQRKQDARPDLYRAILTGASMPPLDLNVRGQDYGSSEGNGFVIRNKVYVIDGGGRLQEALNVLENDPNADVRMQAVIHFGGDVDWERHRFSDLNRNVSKVSVNLHLKNFRDQSPAVATLFGLSNNDKSFPLFGKVAWGQRMVRGELITAMQILRTMQHLHAHLPQGKRGDGTSKRGGSVMTTAASRVQTVADQIKLPTFRANVAAYFDLIDKCWGIKVVEYGKSAPHLRGAFNKALAGVLSEHEDFWVNDGTALRVPAALRRKLATFPVNDPHIANLASGNSAGAKVLEELIIKHINSGKRQRRLVSRYER